MAARPGGFLYADDDVLRGVTLALRRVDRDARKEWAKSMRTTGTRVWRSAVDKRRRLPQDRIFGRPSVAWSMGGKGTAKVKVQPLSGGLGTGDRDWALVDFGTATPRGRQLPRRVPAGRVVFGAVDPFGRWMGAMALRTTADLIRDATGAPP